MDAPTDRLEAAADPVLERDARAVRRQRRALDVVVDHVRGAGRDVALDQLDVVADAERRVEGVRVVGEGHAPVVAVDRVDRLAVVGDVELLEVAEDLAGRASTKIVRVENVLAAYESPYTNTVIAA